MLLCLWLPLFSALAAGAAAPSAATASTADGVRDGAAGLERIDRELGEIEALLADAHFHTALGLADATRALLEPRDDDPARAARRARLELLTATAQVALGHRARARESLRRALVADPALELDERETSPKLVKLLREARALGPLPAEAAP